MSKSLKRTTSVSQLASVDVVGALDMYMEKGEWQKALETAEQHNPQVLHKYVALYATHLIKNGDTYRAMDQYVKYGAPANPSVRTALLDFDTFLKYAFNVKCTLINIYVKRQLLLLHH